MRNMQCEKKGREGRRRVQKWRKSIETGERNKGNIEEKDRQEDFNKR